MLFVEKSSTSTLQVEIKPESKDAFVDWQASFNAQIVSAPGFLSLEFSLEKENVWAIVQRFINSEFSDAWYNSEEYKNLTTQLKPLTMKDQVTIENDPKKGITELIITEVSPGREENYRLWTAKIHHSEAKFPGFRGVYVQPPKGAGTHWITLLQFDTTENLENWLQSKERKEILEESNSFISSLETHQVISPFAGWFATIAKTGEVPPVWKQTMLVLLVLFPIVMLEMKYLAPLTARFDHSVATFIGNALSVTLISFPMMPLAIRSLGWWLTTKELKVNIAGTMLVCILYLIEIILCAQL